MGSIFVIFVFSFLMLTIILILYFIQCCVTPARRIYERIKSYFLWNFMIRLVFEASLELVFCCVLNITYGNIFDYDEENVGVGSKINFYFSVFIGVLILASPLLILLFYNFNFEKVGEE